MNILTWALQIILAVKFISSAFIHAFRQDKPTLQYGIKKMGAKSKPILAVVSALLAIDAVFLSSPAVGLGREDYRLCRLPRRAAYAGIDRVSSEMPGDAEGLGEYDIVYSSSHIDNFLDCIIKICSQFNL